ncbi:hypothetical protein N6H14_26225 [Paenibacillus sp. CC-CFT747]|nr:hypothetical protein N6H14_26225 [Paenibacillus sp. CC-CFT747]
MNGETAQKYSPYLYFDRSEPFYPVRVGVTEIRTEQASPSFPRKLSFVDPNLDLIVEYAIYWDYDIGHLYELEHVWVFVGKSGEVLDCEASFHGRYLKGLLKDRSNLADHTHVILSLFAAGKARFFAIAAVLRADSRFDERRKRKSGKRRAFGSRLLPGRL